MSRAAQAEPMEMSEATIGTATGTDGSVGLREMAAARLAAHRTRRAEVAARDQEMQALVEARRRESRRGSVKVRDAVVARYETTPSYQEYLAAEAERALRQAQAEADIAARNAAAIAEAKARLLEELEQWNGRDSDAGPLQRAMRETEQPFLVEEPAPRAMPSGLKVQLLEDLKPVSLTVSLLEPARPAVSLAEDAEQELEELEEEIAFRLSPERNDHSIETQPIPANIIAFPRQLVAAKKARPRLAEGPLLEPHEAEPQLRIFEVEADLTAAVSDAVGLAPAAPEWQSLQLGAPTPVAEAAPSSLPRSSTDHVPMAAPLELRAMAGCVDACLVGFALLGFATVVGTIGGARLLAVPAPLLGGAAAVAAGAVYLLYQLLFFTLNVATPGMYYARVGLCTFHDRNPSRKEMRRRVLAKVIAACPLGLGVAWALLDEERLGWHDRMSRMYLRAY